MNIPDRNSEKPLALEDLLKIKRHERPDNAFWEEFDKQLHEKTLKKLVFKPSLYSRLSQFFSISFRPALSAGALALLTIIVQPVFFSRTASVIVENSPSAHQVDLINDFASAKRNYVKNNIVAGSGDDCNYANMQISPASSSGVRYLAGNLASVSLSNTITSNTVY